MHAAARPVNNYPIVVLVVWGLLVWAQRARATNMGALLLWAVRSDPVPASRAMLMQLPHVATRHGQLLLRGLLLHA